VCHVSEDQELLSAMFRRIDPRHNLNESNGSVSASRWSDGAFSRNGAFGNIDPGRDGAGISDRTGKAGGGAVLPVDNGYDAAMSVL
jgi:hypothetical protein